MTSLVTLWRCWINQTQSVGATCCRSLLTGSQARSNHYRGSRRQSTKAGLLLPDRLLVLHFVPRRTTGSASPKGATGVTCAGLPLAMIVAGAGSGMKRRKGLPRMLNNAATAALIAATTAGKALVDDDCAKKAPGRWPSGRYDQLRSCPPE